MSTDTDPEPLEFERAHRRRRVHLALVVGAIVLVPVVFLIRHELQAASARRDARLSAGQKAELAALLDQRDALARERVERWNAVVQREALAASSIGSDPCPVTLQLPSAGAAAEYSKMATHSPDFGAWPLCVLRAADDSKPCARTATADPTRAAMRERISADEVYSWDLEQLKASPPQEEPPAVLVLVASETRPVVHSPTVGRVSFAPGTLSGRSFLYAPALGRFVCAGDVSVRNSKNIDIEVSQFGEEPTAQQKTAEFETRAALERDLELHLRFATPPALRALQRP